MVLTAPWLGGDLVMNLLFRFGMLLALFSLFGCGDDNTSTLFPSARTWKPAEVISGDQPAYSVQPVMDGKGNALVAWRSGNFLYSKKYSVASGWDLAAERVDNATNSAYAHTLAMNTNGEGVAVWRAEESSGDHFYARRFSMATGWDVNFQLLSNNTNDGYVPDVAINAAGNIMSVFPKWSPNEVFARGYVPGAGWDASPAVIGTSALSSINWPRVALDDNGNGVAVWEQNDGAYARHYSAGVGWDATVTQLGSGLVNRTYIALNAQGAGIAFWDLQDGTYQINARTFHSGPVPGWNTEIFEVVSSAVSIGDVSGAIDPDGNIVITWTVRDGTRTKMFARGYSPANGWDASITTVSDPLLDLDVDAAFFAMGKDGKGLAVWSQDSETDPTVYAREYKAGSGWGSKIQTVYSFPDGFGGTVSSLSMTPDGKALVIVTSYDLPAYSTSKVIAIFSR
jgi:hypothetical protein